ncbi:hypothetical protein PR202_ga04078 [Eleusine coracana subsp. coracana]|uniref:NAC domain-containing protein n=1 Tax=Eleusine coracana subsp. coracana TaxID=191504 RepID=A0AAV5BR23_ELECO|nr:hypothetical protein PR202_ga04078 [Eleusine coracana subsp. coracana]
MSRCVEGGGTWHGSSKRKPVGNHEGYRQGFEYWAPGDQKTVWIMEEFVSSLEAATDARGVKVVCEVYHSLTGARILSLYDIPRFKAFGGTVQA